MLYPTGERLWTQHLYKSSWATYLGAAHGFAGNVHALLAAGNLLDPEDVASISRSSVSAIKTLAQSDGGYVNWPRLYGFENLPTLDEEARLQWCHGAPGFITSAGHIRPGFDREFDDVLRRAGELIWSAGPPRSDAGICHGAAGNGWALLKLYRRTGEDLWLERARAFAMHAIDVMEERRAENDAGWFSLFTGDLGTAAYLAACCELDDRLPSLDYLPRPS